MKKYVFSHSQLAAAECSNKYHILYDLKLRSKRYSKVRALKIGTLFHAGLEMIYKLSRNGMSFDDLTNDVVLDRAITHVRALALQMRGQLVPDEGFNRKVFERKLDIDMEVPVIMLKAYYNHVFLTERYEIVEPERRVEVNVRTPSGRKSPNMFYLGFMDAVIKNIAGDGRNYLHEVKTAATWTEKNDHFLAIDNQTTSYHWVARELDSMPNEPTLNLAGTIYTVCLKPGSQIRLTAEAKKKARDFKKENGYAYKYDPIEDYETAQDYLARIEEDYMSNPSKYFVRRIFTRSKEQLDRFGLELYYKCQDAKRVRRQPNFMQPSMMRCPGCVGYDLCQDWTDETMRRWYVSREEADAMETIEEIILED